MGSPFDDSNPMLSAFRCAVFEALEQRDAVDQAQAIADGLVLAGKFLSFAGCLIAWVVASGRKSRIDGTAATRPVLGD